MTQWGSLGSDNSQFNSPQGIAVYANGVNANGNIYVTDSGNDRIQEFTSTGTYVTQWGSSGAGNGQFYFPQGIAIDNTGNVYVVDSGNFRVQEFTSSGTYVTQVGSYGPANNQFNWPEGIAVDTNRNIYVADTENNRIQTISMPSGSGCGTAGNLVQFGIAGDIPVVGDWNGDGRTDIGVFRPSNGTWYLDYNNDGTFSKHVKFGIAGDIPVVGDWNGDGRTDIGVFRPSNGTWYSVTITSTRPLARPTGRSTGMSTARYSSARTGTFL